MSASLATARAFPWTDMFQGKRVTFELMTPEDGPRLQEFSHGLDPDDLLFLRMDIRQPAVIEEWVENVRRGRTITVLATRDDHGVIGYCSLHHNELLWTRHHGELRVFVLRAYRGIRLGVRLLGEVFQIAREQHLERLIVNLPSDQPHVRMMLEHLGFQVEALLTNWLMSQDGKKHDLLIMSHEVAEA